MRVTRIYQPVRLTSGIKTSLTPEAANHLVRVLRLPVGAELRVFNGEGGEFSAIIISISKQEVLIEIIEYLENSSESLLAIHLGQAISRGEKMDYTIQKAVELGVNQITPLIAERCEVKLLPERWEKRWRHWQVVAIAACEQCGRNRVPFIAKPLLITEWIKSVQADVKIILQPDSILKKLPRNDGVREIALLAGSEGGFTEKEVGYAVQQGFNSVQLGPRVLRTETAALAAIAILQAKWGDMTM